MTAKPHIFHKNGRWYLTDVVRTISAKSKTVRGVCRIYKRHLKVGVYEGHQKNAVALAPVIAEFERMEKANYK
jgi:hypothetical protein